MTAPHDTRDDSDEADAMANAVRISSSRLTTCGVLPDAETVRLDLIDEAGTPVSMRFPIEQIVALSMTLPHLLAEAAKVRTGDDEARYVFSLGDWAVKADRQHDCLVMTLTTPDGFEVSFSFPFVAGRALGRLLKREADRGIDSRTTAGEPDASPRSRYN